MEMNTQSGPEALRIASDLLIAPNDLDESCLSHALADIHKRDTTYADLYFEHTVNESFGLDEGEVKSVGRQQYQGLGVRAVAGERVGFAHSHLISREALSRSAEASSQIAGLAGNTGSRSRAIDVFYKPVYSTHYHSLDPLTSVGESDKIAILRRVDEVARSLDTRIEKVTASLTGSWQVVLIVDGDEQMVADLRPMVTLSMNVLAYGSGRVGQGASSYSARHGYALFTQEIVASCVRDAVESALLNLEAEAAPAGEMTIVLAAGSGGVLLHEAVGHGLEGDFNRKGQSLYTGRVGERVAAAGVTLVDCGALPGLRGSLNVDDEGTPTRSTVLIDDGILVGYMQDKLNASLMNVPPTGNARRQSYAHPPMPRMTNTYMLAGAYEPEEIIASVKHGLYVKQVGGGQVDITSGNFVFGAQVAYRIENGRLGAPVRGATLIGNGPEVMQRVSMIGKDLVMDPEGKVCGKAAQSVPVGVGQPTLRIDCVTVGGTG